jgi:hypothetical protein
MMGAMLRGGDRRTGKPGNEYQKAVLAGPGPALCMPNLFMVAFPFLPNRSSSIHACT